MRKLKLYILILSFGLISTSAIAEDEEEVQPSNPQELLEIVRQGQFADTQQQRAREAQFRNEKNRQLSFYRMLKMKEPDSKEKQLDLNRSSKQMKLYL